MRIYSAVWKRRPLSWLVTVIVGLSIVLATGFFSWAQAQSGTEIIFEVVDSSGAQHTIQANCILSGDSSPAETVFTNCSNITFRLSPGNYGELN